jgi:hypothetical protein
MTKVIGDPIRSGRTALVVTVALGLLALAAALVSLGCASRERVAGVQPIGRDAPPAEVGVAGISHRNSVGDTRFLAAYRSGWPSSQLS